MMAFALPSRSEETVNASSRTVSPDRLASAL